MKKIFEATVDELDDQTVEVWEDDGMFTVAVQGERRETFVMDKDQAAEFASAIIQSTPEGAEL